MAEERTIPKKHVGIDDVDMGMSRDDWRALRHVLLSVKGISPSSMSPLTLEEYEV